MLCGGLASVNQNVQKIFFISFANRLDTQNKRRYNNNCEAQTPAKNTRSNTMTTKIKNIETGAVVEINLIDPKSGCDWSMALISDSNDDQLIPSDDDDYNYVADTETINWWVDLCGRLQTADNELYDAIKNCDDDAKWDIVNDMDLRCDLEYQPEIKLQAAAEIKNLSE